MPEPIITNSILQLPKVRIDYPADMPIDDVITQFIKRTGKAPGKIYLFSNGKFTHYSVEVEV